MLENSVYGNCVGSAVIQCIRYDLHSRSILVRNKQFVKMINFGKEFIVENAVYNITILEELQKRQNISMHILSTSHEISQGLLL